jgi:hypothetical protein
MDKEYFIFKTIMTALDLDLVGKELADFVTNSTGCTVKEFEYIYEQVLEAWCK